MKAIGSGDQGMRLSSLPRIILIASIGLVVAVSAFANAFVNVTRTTNPGIALKMPYTDPIALAASADQLVTGNPKLLKLPSVERSARDSLAGQALNPRALRLLGYIAGEKGNPVVAGRLVRLAERASRREVSAQFWLIEDCVARGDVPCSIEHYDVAMRTQPEVRPVLFPVLTQAMSEPEVRQTLAPRIGANPSWLYDFVNYATVTLSKPSWLSATLINAGGLPKDSIYRQIETNLLGQLVAKDEFEAARKYANFLSGGVLKKFDAIGFSALTTDQRFMPLSWQAISTPTSDATFEQVGGKEGLVLHIVAGTGDRVTMVRRLLFPTPGLYQFDVGQMDGSLASDSALTWTLSCAKTVDRRVAWSGAVKKGRSDSFIVPASCPAVMLELNASSGSGQEGLDMKISDINMHRVR